MLVVKIFKANVIFNLIICKRHIKQQITFPEQSLCLSVVIDPNRETRRLGVC